MFLVPVVAAVGSAIGSAFAAVGSTIGGLLGATAATTTTAGTIGGAVGSLAPTVAPAATGLFGTGISGWQLLSLGGTVMSGLAQMTASQQQSAAYQIQATNALIQGQQQSMEYQRQGVSVLNRTIETSALINARAGAGGIDPYSGSASTLAEFAMNKGVDEFIWAKDSSSMALMSGQGSYASNMAAAASSRSMGMMNLIGTGLTGIAKLKALS